MIRIRRQDIVDCLSRLGLSRGQTIYLQIDLRTIGVIDGASTREAYCQAYLDAVFELVGETGTIVAPTYTTQVARFDMDFIWESTPTVLGTFPEFVRQHPDSLRSIHPLHSVTAIGDGKARICANNGLSDFGLGSPFDRLLTEGAKILTIGLESGYVVGISHHLDAACCSPFVYNKLLKWIPIVNGERIANRYVSSARHLNLKVSYHLRRFVKHMRALGGVDSSRLGGSWAHIADYRQVFAEGVRLMQQDPFYMLKEPPNFVYGDLPFDGPTAGRDGMASATQIGRTEGVNWRGYYLDRSSPGGDEDDLAQLEQMAR